MEYIKVYGLEFCSVRGFYITEKYVKVLPTNTSDELVEFIF